MYYRQMYKFLMPFKNINLWPLNWIIIYWNNITFFIECSSISILRSHPIRSASPFTLFSGSKLLNSRQEQLQRTVVFCSIANFNKLVWSFWSSSVFFSKLLYDLWQSITSSSSLQIKTQMYIINCDAVSSIGGYNLLYCK